MSYADYLQVFISSVMSVEDLSAERQSAMAAIEAIPLTRPWAFEFSPAEPNPAEAVYLREVEKSDLLILIVSKTHSPPVQKEIEAAENANVKILAFVRRLDSSLGQTPERRDVIQWLSNRVKYEAFTTPEDLKDRVSAAIVLELVHGYRKYRIERRDFQTLIQRTQSLPGLVVRPAREDEVVDVGMTLREISDWYPHIGGWIQKVISEMTGAEVRVAEFAGEIAGLSISREKEPGVRKFSTI